MKNEIKNRIHLFSFLLIFSFLFLPYFAQAQTSRIYFSPEIKEVYQGDVFLMELRISSPDKKINVVDCVLSFDKDKLEVKGLSDGGSILNLWTQRPDFSNQEGKISFVGGTPDGFQRESGLVLKIAFFAKKLGKAKLDFQDTTSFFLADGKGTPVNPWLKSLTLEILEKPAEITAKDEWQSIIEKDKTPPEPFEIKLGQDPSLFNNQYFISFHTTDGQSGIDYYQVKEGERDFEKAESPYLLKDQSLKSLIYVKAVDLAGNERIAEHTPEIAKRPLPYWIIIIIIVGLAIIVWRVRKFLISKS